MALMTARDLRLAVRSVSRGGTTTLVAVLSLAIGIAANSTIFSLVQAVEFPTLVYPDAAGIVFVESRNHPRGIAGMLVSLPDAADLAGSARALAVSGIAADQTSIMRAGSGVRRVGGRRVTPGFFDALQVPAALGRTLVRDDREGVLVLSDGLWRSQFAADPSVIGRPVRLDGGVVVVVGVMPPRFDRDADFWVPFRPSADWRRDDRQFSVFARLAPGTSVDAAAGEVRAISARLAAEHPATNADWEMYPVPISRLHGRDSRVTFFLLQAAVAFVLLIACANIANILLARATGRRHEMAVRLSLGATRGRLMGGLLAESAVLSVAGGALGVLLAMWGIRAARAIGGFPDVLDPRLNLWGLGFAAMLSMLTTFACGILPALQASSIRPGTVLNSEGRTFAGSRGAARSVLVVVQIAVAVVLVTCGTLMLRSLVNRLQVDLGFDPRGVVRGDVALPPDRYRDGEAMRSAVDRILAAVRGDAGVVAAGASTWALPTGAGGQRALTLPGRDDRTLPATVRRGFEAVTPGYFDALGLPLRAGRDFNRADGAGGPPVAIVNEELAQRLFAGENPVGQPLRLGTPADGASIATIVGVVATARRSPMHDAPVARVYVPYAQHPNGMPAFVVRSNERADAAMRGLEDAVHRLDEELLVDNLRTMTDEVGRFVAPVRLLTSLLGAFAVVGLLLAALGVFGSMSYAAAQRRRELAVRSALGATRRDIVRLVVAGASRVILPGVVLGVIGALFAARAIAGQVFGVSALDPLTLAGAGLLMAVIALASSYRPARTAASVDPLMVLRE